MSITSGPAAAQEQVDELHARARAAETRYERLARWLAPGTYRSGGGSCDEVVGRFCLNFDTMSKPPREPERGQVSEARARAVDALRAFAHRVPGDVRAAGPLVRLLVEAGAAEDAVAAARRYAASGADSLWAEWLLGYALHAAARDSAAAQSFERALGRLTAVERERIESIEWLLSVAEWKKVRSLPDSARAAYVGRFWRLADPMWLTAVNETWVEHVARHVEVRLLERVPVVPGLMYWGDDLAELTVRYGRPVARERDLNNREQRVSMVEHFDTSALAYAPEALSRDGVPPPLPGARWTLKSPRARSAHAPPAVGRAHPLPHQLTRLPLGRRMRVRVDARVPADSGGSAGARVLLLGRSWSGDTVALERRTLLGGEEQLTMVIDVPRDTLLVAAEVFEPGRRTLLRARQVVEPLAGGAVELSDILLTTPLPSTAGATGVGVPRALTSLLLPGGQDVGIQVLVAGVEPGAAMDVEVSFVRADSPSLLARAVGWAGRRLGLGRSASPPRVRWRAVAGDPALIEVNLASPERAGDYHVEVAVRSQRGEATARRLVRILSGPEAE